MKEQQRSDCSMIMSTIANLYAKYKCPIFTKENKFLDPTYHDELSIKLTKKLKLDNEIIYEHLRNIFMAIAEVQIEYGYLLIGKESLKNKNQKSSNINDSVTLKIEHLYLQHHCYMAIECIYRIWEKLTKLLIYIYFPQNKDNIYFNNLIELFKQSDSLPSPDLIINLKKFNKHWQKIASLRNSASHKSSHLAKNYHLSIEKSVICDYFGKQIIKIQEKLPDFNIEIDFILNAFKKANEAASIIILTLDNQT